MARTKEPDYAYIAKLVMACWNDDSDAFAELYAMTYNKVYNYCHHYLRDAYLAQDAVQEIYINALENIHKLNDPTLFVAWLNQISFHVCFDICKKNNVKYETVDSETLDFLQDETHDDLHPEKASMKKAESEQLKIAIESLPLNEQQVIILRYFNNMKLLEVARTLGISLATAKRYLGSAQSALKKLMSS